MPSPCSSHSLDETSVEESKVEVPNDTREKGDGEIENDETPVDGEIENDETPVDGNFFCMDEFSRDSLGDRFSESKNEAFPSQRTNSSTKEERSVANPMPTARWGHSMTMIDHRKLIVYGGQTVDATRRAKPLADLFVYDLLERKWAKPTNCESIARAWHSANFLPDRQLLLCFGGDVLDERTGTMTPTDQLMALDTEIMLWYPPSVSGTAPSGRSGHTSSVLHATNELVVFGGVKTGGWSNSVSVLDTNRWMWYSPKIVGDVPPPRSYHSATAIGDDCSSGGKIVIFGGNDETRCFNGVVVLESSGDQKWRWSHPNVSGKAPSPRTGHSATLLDDNKTILIYGGWDPNAEDDKGEDTIFGDSFLLDTKSWTWTKGPKARGVDGVRDGSGNASKEGQERVGHSAVLAPGTDGVHVLAFGGRLPDDRFAADFQSLKVAPRAAGPSRSSARQR